MRAWSRYGMMLMLGVLVCAAGCSPNTGPRPENTSSVGTTGRVKDVPTFSFSEPTAAPAVATAGATLAAAVETTAEAVTLDPDAVERGKGRYEALKCATCHGEEGAGTQDTITLKVYTGTEDQFVTFMRSGGKLGAAHQYATNRLSDAGASNLYQYLVSLRGQ